MPSDRQLQRAVLDALAFEPSIDAAHLGVRAKAGVVTLTGHVGSYAEKSRAERAARRVSGVRAIAEEIEVLLPAHRQCADDEIAARALAVLHWDGAVPDERIAITVEKGVVTLSGSVDWQYQKADAEDDIRRLDGVVGVVNRIGLTPRADPSQLRDKIARALARNAAIEAAHIAITVDRGKVTLAGAVNNWHEREIAERAAWSAPGVCAVDDQITLSRP